jgi:uracil phosphoribosyltransferase
MEQDSSDDMDDNDSTFASLAESRRVEAEAAFLLGHQQDVQLTFQISRGRLLEMPTAPVAQVWPDEAPSPGLSPMSSTSISSCSSPTLDLSAARAAPTISVRTTDAETRRIAGTDESPTDPTNNGVNFHREKQKIRVLDVKPRAKIFKLPSSSRKPVVRKYCYVLGDAGASSFDPSRLLVEEIPSRAVALLLTKLRSRSTTPSEFRRVSERLMRLVIEEALVLVPLRRAPMMLPNGQRGAGVSAVLPPCAVSMEDDASPMLELFHDMEPQHPTGYLCFNAERDAFGPRLLDAHLPLSLAQHDVFLLEHALASGDRLCAAVRRLQVRGASASKIIVASLIASTEAIQELQAHYPGVKLITSQIVPDVVRCSAGETAGGHDSSAFSQVSSMRLRLLEAYRTK